MNRTREWGTDAGQSGRIRGDSVQVGMEPFPKWTNIEPGDPLDAPIVVNGHAGVQAKLSWRGGTVVLRELPPFDGDGGLWEHGGWQCSLETEGAKNGWVGELHSSFRDAVAEAVEELESQPRR
jgi:hypothetical protein